MATCEVIELKRVADLPTGHGMFCKTDCKTAQEALGWGEKLGAEWCVPIYSKERCYARLGAKFPYCIGGCMFYTIFGIVLSQFDVALIWAAICGSLAAAIWIPFVNEARKHK